MLQKILQIITRDSILLYDINNKLEAIEIFDSKFKINGKDVDISNPSTVISIVGSMDKDGDQYTSIDKSVGITIKDGKIYTILFGRKGYYDSKKESTNDEVITESFGALLAGISGAIIAGKAVVKLAKKVEDKSTKKTEDDKPKKQVKIDTSSIDKGIIDLEKYHESISNIEKKGGNPTNVIVDASLILDEIAKKQREIYDATEAGTPERDVAKEVGKRIEAVAAKLKICTSKGTTAEVKTEAYIALEKAINNMEGVN